MSSHNWADFGQNDLFWFLLKKTINRVGYSALFISTLGVIRTRDPLLRKQVLYPLSYEGIYFKTDCTTRRNKWQYLRVTGDIAGFRLEIEIAKTSN
jgi:hypothetical protein